MMLIDKSQSLKWYKELAAGTWTNWGLQLALADSFSTCATAALDISSARWTVKLPSVSAQSYFSEMDITLEQLLAQYNKQK